MPSFQKTFDSRTISRELPLKIFMRAEGHSVCACDFEISYERMRWPAINNGGLRGDRFRVRVVLCVVYLPCLTSRRCQKMERGLSCLWQKVTAKYFRIIRGNHNL